MSRTKRRPHSRWGWYYCGDNRTEDGTPYRIDSVTYQGFYIRRRVSWPGYSKPTTYHALDRVWTRLRDLYEEIERRAV